MGESALSCHEARELTLYSMKSTMLAATAQLAVSREDRLAQGHRREFARLYSRNNAFDSLRVQRRLAAQVAHGWKPSRSMARGGSAPLPEPPFSVVQQGTFLPWTCGRAHGSASHRVAKPCPSRRSPAHRFRQRSRSCSGVRGIAGRLDDETTEDSADSKVLFVCNGPWSCLQRNGNPADRVPAECIPTSCNAPHALRDQAWPRSDSTFGSAIHLTGAVAMAARSKMSVFSAPLNALLLCSLAPF